MIHDGSSEVLGVSMATSSGLVALKNSPDFNRPVTLQVGADPPAASPHKSVMEMVCNSDTARLAMARNRVVERKQVQYFSVS